MALKLEQPCYYQLIRACDYCAPSKRRDLELARTLSSKAFTLKMHTNYERVRIGAAVLRVQGSTTA